MFTRGQGSAFVIEKGAENVFSTAVETSSLLLPGYSCREGDVESTKSSKQFDGEGSDLEKCS
jgi:hypothetical protein